MKRSGTTRRRPGVVAVSSTLAIALFVSLGLVAGCGGSPQPSFGDAERLELPPPARDGATSLETAIAARRSVRDFAPRRLSDVEISQLLFAAQGITGEDGERAAPSAGGCYPLTLYVIRKARDEATSDKTEIESLFRYVPEDHALVRLASDDGTAASPSLTECVDQDSARDAPALVLITGDVARTEAKYGDGRSEMYVHVEAGHAAQNLLLQAVASGLGAVPLGGFDPQCVRRELRLPPDEDPLYVIAIGEPLAK